MPKYHSHKIIHSECNIFNVTEYDFMEKCTLDLVLENKFIITEVYFYFLQRGHLPYLLYLYL